MCPATEEGPSLIQRTLFAFPIISSCRQFPVLRHFLRQCVSRTRMGGDPYLYTAVTSIESLSPPVAMKEMLPIFSQADIN